MGRCAARPPGADSQSFLEGTGYADPGRDLSAPQAWRSGWSREPGGCARSSRAASTCSSSGPPGMPLDGSPAAAARRDRRRRGRHPRWPSPTSARTTGPRPVARHQPRRRPVPGDRPDADDARLRPGPRPGPPDGRVRPPARRPDRARRRGRRRRRGAARRLRQPLRRRPGRGRPDARASSSRAPRWS